MKLDTLSLEGFRNLLDAEIHWHPDTNVLVGENAAGKTALLEAIHFLGRNRSFRTARREALIRQGATGFRLVASLSDGDRHHRLGMEGTRQGVRVRYDGQDLRRRSDLVDLLPLQLLNQDAHLLIEAGPEYRRRFLDWGVFHVEPSYRDALARYRRLLQQRNAALRQGLAERAVRAWDAELVRVSEVMDHRREAYVRALQDALEGLLEPLVALRAVQLHYRRGWPAEQRLDELLGQQLSADRARGFTFFGPHRADLGIRVQGRPARERLSRGQQKLLVCGLILAQLCLYHAGTGRPALLLVDDLASELDAWHRDRLFRLLLELPAQRFVTAIEAGQLPELAGAGAWFHVKQGQVRNVVYS